MHRSLSSTIPLALWLSVVLSLVLTVAAQFAHPDSGLTKPVPAITPVPKAPPATVCIAGSGPTSMMGGSCSTTTTTPVSDPSGLGCCQCPAGQYSADGLKCRALSSCVNGRVSIAASGVDVTSNAGPAATGCACVAGFGDYNVNSKTCRQCPVNTYSSNNQCIPCDPNNYSARGSSSCVPYPLQVKGVPVKPPSVQCSPGSAPNSAGTCVSCNPGQYSVDGLQCLPCLNGKTPNNGNIDMTVSGASQCVCLTGYGDWSVGAKMCQQCPINTYSSNFKCVPCATNSFAPRGSGSCSAVQCATGSYMPPGGTTLASCVKCGYGTNGRVCGSMTACKCAPGFANFDRRSGQCFQCHTLTSISVYANITNPDDSRTVCKECPKLTAPIADRRTCVPISGAPSDVTSYPPTPIQGLTCGCLNGYDYTYTLYDSTGATLASAYLDHSAYADTDVAILSFSGRYSNIVGSQFIGLAIDQATNLVVGGISLNSGTSGVVGGSTWSNILPVIGKSCTDALTLQGLFTKCFTVSQSDSSTKLSTLVPANTFTSGGDGNFNFVCGNSLTYLPSSCPTVQGTQLTLELTITDVMASNSPNSIFSGSDGGIFVNGNSAGSTGFGSKVIAFYTQDDMKIKFVIRASPSQPKSILVDSTVLSASFIGTACPSSDPNVAACYPITNQWLPMNIILNGVDSAAVDTASSDVRITGQCADPNTNT